MRAVGTTRRAADRRRPGRAEHDRRGQGGQLLLGTAAPARETGAGLLSDRLARERACTGTTDLRPGGGATLDDLLVGAWEGLSARRTVTCPVCSGALAPAGPSGSAAAGGRCVDCGTTLT